MATAGVWVAILASVTLALAAACLFVFAVKRQYFRDFEDAKYHVFWSDLQDLVDGSVEDPSRGASSSRPTPPGQ